MGDLPRTGWVYEDLQTIDDDRHRYEIIDGELFVSPSPSTAHQRAVLRIGAALLAHVDRYGGEVFVAPLDVYFASDTVVEPDVVYVAPANVARVTEPFVNGAPDLVVEVSSPSTRRVDLGRKRDLYQREGVPEYWFVDVEAQRVLVHRLAEGAYDPPEIAGPDGVLRPTAVASFEITVDEVFSRP